MARVISLDVLSGGTVVTPPYVWVKPKRERPPHPTALKLLDVTVALLDEVPVDALTLAMVLERSDVSHGSLYHHYEDFPDLVEKAAVHRYTRGLRESLVAVAALLECADATEFRRRAVELIRASHDRARRPNRLERVDVLGALRSRPRLAQAIGRAQREITEEQAEHYAELQRRGWMRADVDPVVASTMVQAMILGRVVDDISEQPVDDRHWTEAAVRVVSSLLFED